MYENKVNEILFYLAFESIESDFTKEVEGERSNISGDGVVCF